MSRLLNFLRIGESTFGRSLPTNSNRIFKMSSASDASRVVTYDDVVSYDKKPNVLLIDVREPNELKETGELPASINIPLGEVSTTLKNLSPSDFKTRYGRDFPEKETELVFSCKMGRRAKTAMDSAIQLGFSNSKYYEGSWTDYASKKP